VTGILSTAQRNAAIARLKAAAERFLSQSASKSKGKSGALRKSLAALESAWRSFPECERDKAVPSAERILEICARMEADEIARLRWEAALS